MIIPYGKYLLVQIIDPPKKKGLLLLNEEEDPIARCEFLDRGGDCECAFFDGLILLIRRYELRDCVDKDKKIYLIKEESVLGYEEGE